MPARSAAPRWRAWLGLAVALFGLNLALSFDNLWPTPWITTRHQLSVEIACLVLVLAVLGELGRWPSRRALRWLAVLVALFAVARYMEVTAPALYGRGINLYWDVQHLPHVAAMLVAALPAGQVWLLGASVLLLLAGLYLLVRWLLGLLIDRLADAPLRRFTLTLSASLIAVYAAGLIHPAIKAPRVFSLPVSVTYAQQAGFVYDAVAGNSAPQIQAQPLPRSSLAGLGDADVLVLFLESYGATTLDRDDFARSLDGAKQLLSRSIAQSGYQVASARVRSPTFGGASWLAHSTFLSGIEITDDHLYQLLLTRQRDTLVHHFASQGYRTVGLMPGLKRAWPEGAFYGYDKIYDAAALDYPGPAFGWWRIPDQYALARFDAEEIEPSPRAPLMAVMATISSHAPFRPVPPYQADWQVLLGKEPYTAWAAAAAEPQRAGWDSMAEDYIAAIDYVLTCIAGYLTRRSRDNLVLIIIGDHQPLARISRPSASWDVPVHVVTSNAALIAALETEGFVRGLEPPAKAIGPMHGLAARLLRVFDDPTAAADAPEQRREAKSPRSTARPQSRVDISRVGVGR